MIKNEFAYLYVKTIAWPYMMPIYSRSSLCFKNDCIFIISNYQRTLTEYESKATLIKNVHVFK